MVPEKLLAYRLRGTGVKTVAPWYLDASDHGWLTLLQELYQSHEGRPRGALDMTLRASLGFAAPRAKLRLALHVLDRLYHTRVQSEVPPAQARAAVFGAAARQRDGRARLAVLAQVAGELGTTVPLLEQALFADLPAERRMQAPAEATGPAELALRANLALVQGLLHRSTSVEIRLEGQARPIVRHAKLRGLICVVRWRASDGGWPHLEISGPLALFGRTLLYGRALAELVPYLAWCNRFELRAGVLLRGETALLCLSRGAPLFPSRPPKRFDSKLEERFAKDFARHCTDWVLVREPEPMAAGDTLVFPDFAAARRDDPTCRWLIEIVGFWTPEYLQRKLAHLRQLCRDRFVLCVDRTLGCAEALASLPAVVVPFSRRIDVGEVLEVLEQRHCGRTRDSNLRPG